MNNEEDFVANSRRVRLEQLAHVCETALRFIDTGLTDSAKTIVPCPDISKITGFMPLLQPIIEARWLEAQKCQHAGAYLSAVIMMGSILEGILLGVANAKKPDAYRAKSSPKDGKGNQIRVED